MIRRLLEIECIKLGQSKSVKIISLIYILITVLVLIISMNAVDLLNSFDALEEVVSPFGFPGIWLTGTWLSALLVIFPVMISILHIGSEFTQKIHRQHIIDGLSKNEYVLSKFLSLIIISLAFTIYTLLLCILAGILIGGDETSINTEVNNNFFLYIIGYFVYIFSILSFAMLITFLLRKTGRSIFAFMTYYFFLEMIITFFTKYTFIPKFLPITSIANNIFPNPSGTTIRISSKFGPPPSMTEVEKVKNGELSEEYMIAADKYMMESDKYMTEVEKYWGRLWENWMMFDWQAVLLAIVYIGIYFLIIRWLFLKRDL